MHIFGQVRRVRVPVDSPPLGQATRSVEHTQDLDRLAPHPIGHDVAGLGHDQFAGAGHSTCPAEPRLLREHCHGVEDTLDNEACRSDVIGRPGRVPGTRELIVEIGRASCRERV